MTKANRLGMYADIRAVLDAALAAGGGTFSCETHGAAVHWRQRANQFRKHYAEVLGPKAMLPYDMLIFPRIGPDSCEVTIKIRQIAGVFTPAINDVQVSTSNDALLEAAESLRRRLEGGVAP